MAASTPTEKEAEQVAQAAADSLYLPSGVREHRFFMLKTRVAYRVWRRTLRRYAGLGRESRFKLLDVGCGPGYLLRCLELWFPHIHSYGFDVEQKYLDFAGGHLRRTQLVHGRAEQLPFDKEFFRIVCALHVLEHLNRPGELLAEAYRVLRPGGLLLAATPNPGGIAARLLKGRWSGWRDDHVSLKPPREWRELVERAGFAILDDGTTGLGGFRLFQRLPFSLLNWLPLAVFGYFAWEYGESYMLVARKS